MLCICIVYLCARERILAFKMSHLLSPSFFVYVNLRYSVCVRESCISSQTSRQHISEIPTLYCMIFSFFFRVCVCEQERLVRKEAERDRNETFWQLRFHIVYPWHSIKLCCVRLVSYIILDTFVFKWLLSVPSLIFSKFLYLRGSEWLNFDYYMHHVHVTIIVCICISSHQVSIHVQCVKDIIHLDSDSKV